MTRRDAESRAQAAARRDGETRYVISYDSGGEREFGVATWQGIQGFEFAAFEGRVEAEVPSNGDITWF